MMMQRCPFCGRMPEIVSSLDRHFYTAVCKSCYVKALGQTPEKAAEAWNEWVIANKDEIEQAKQLRLRPCPHCGGEAKLRDTERGDRLFYAECNDCGARGGSDKDWIYAAMRWNKRIMRI